MNKERIVWMAGGSILTIAIFLIAQQFFFGESSAEELSVGEVTNQVEERFQAEVQSIQKNNDRFEVEIKEENGLYLVLVDAYEGKILEIESIQPSSDKNKAKEEQADGSDDAKQAEPADDQSDSSDEQEKEEPEEQLLTKAEAEQKVTNQYNGSITASEFVDGEAPYYQVTVDNDQETIQLTVDAKSGSMNVQNRETKQPTIISENEAAQIALNKIGGELDDVELKQVDGTVYYEVEIEVEENDEDEEYILRINGITGEIISVTQDD